MIEERTKSRESKMYSNRKPIESKLSPGAVNKILCGLIISEKKCKKFNLNSNLSDTHMQNYINFTRSMNIKRMIYDPKLFDIKKVPKNQ